MTERKPLGRDEIFQHTVLQGIFACVWLLCKIAKSIPDSASSFRANCLGFGDRFGNQTPEGAEFRRSRTFPELRK